MKYLKYLFLSLFLVSVSLFAAPNLESEGEKAAQQELSSVGQQAESSVESSADNYVQGAGSSLENQGESILHSLGG